MATAHFSDVELRIDRTPSEFRANALAMGALLEQFRGFVSGLSGHDVRWRITNLYEPPGSGIAGRVRGSCHETASAADLVPLDPTPGLLTIARAVQDDAPFDFGELIVYPLDGHVHLTLPGCGGRGEVLVRLAEGGFSPISTARGAATVSVLAVLALAFLVLFLAR